MRCKNFNILGKCSYLIVTNLWFILSKLGMTGLPRGSPARLSWQAKESRSKIYRGQMPAWDSYCCGLNTALKKQQKRQRRKQELAKPPHELWQICFMNGVNRIHPSFWLNHQYSSGGHGNSPTQFPSSSSARDQAKPQGATLHDIVSSNRILFQMDFKWFQAFTFPLLIKFTWALAD